VRGVTTFAAVLCGHAQSKSGQSKNGLTMATEMVRTQLMGHGWQCVRVSYRDWIEHASVEERMAFLRAALMNAGVHPKQ
jgi:hypothetical protein